MCFNSVSVNSPVLLVAVGGVRYVAASCYADALSSRTVPRATVVPEVRGADDGAGTFRISQRGRSPLLVV
jgi:hypothetical protein